MPEDACKKKDEVIAIRTEKPSAGAFYVHVPFCVRRCRYCDFYSMTFDPSKAAACVEGLLTELELRSSVLSRPIQSAFLGGGTPTAIGGELLGRLLDTISPWIDEATEFSVEANPGTVTESIVECFARSGVNRVSLGAQSFDDAELRQLGRIHQADQIGRAVAMLREGGVRNIGLDLIYGVPGQTAESWRKNLHAAIALQPEHLSCYALSIEEGTALADDIGSGRLVEVDDETQRRMYYDTIDLLRDAGYEHYEISNFARPGFRCRHNLVYWRNEPYLGIGPAAASYLQGRRSTNLGDWERWITAVQAGQTPPDDAECLTGKAACAEALMLGLRLIEGVPIDAFSDRYGQTPQAIFPQTFERYQRIGMLRVSQGRLLLAREALFTANLPLADFLAEADNV